ncbi:hypothetical protein KCG44_09175 [Pacificimonas sp. WHA3]|uniref:Uncharacterized protein n=1 Tax=Pacificimonas pallii TaxID=2827236 RepID=A0ABS6SGH7_9SPHN|nr:hypothetical protein [Pacificimonas pallii]MBV7256952.1 hypothetical protein [Pacificimonas pallii]
MKRSELFSRARALAEWETGGRPHRLLRPRSRATWADLATLPHWTERLPGEANRIAADAVDAVTAHRAAGRLDGETLAALEDKRGEAELDRLLAVDTPGALPETGSGIVEAALYASTFRSAARALIGALERTDVDMANVEMPGADMANGA